MVFDHTIHACATRATAKTDAELVQVSGLARGDDFHLAVFGITDPAAQLQLGSLALYKPAEADTLDAPLNKEVEDHRKEPRPVLQMHASAAQAQENYLRGQARGRLHCARVTLEFTMVFVLDNYDSFTYNLVQYLGELGAEVVVRRNDEVTPEEVEAMKPERILLSPGPCTPHEAGYWCR